jgi:hypothetical protein
MKKGFDIPEIVFFVYEQHSCSEYRIAFYVPISLIPNVGSAHISASSIATCCKIVLASNAKPFGVSGQRPDIRQA